MGDNYQSVSGSNNQIGNMIHGSNNSVSNQELSAGYPAFDGVRDAIHQAITALPSDDEKADAIEHAQKFGRALSEGNMSRAKTIWGWFPQGVTMATNVLSALAAAGIKF